jgi:hypothetical protein
MRFRGHVAFKTPPEIRFWAKVIVKGPDDCWEWQAYIDARGYGRFKFEGKDDRAHRVSWVLERGQIPDGLCILHKCDNPKCVNPDHLYIGTHQDNMRDRTDRNRSAHNRIFGERHGHSKATAEQVLEIRKIGHSKSLKEMSALFGLSVSHISRLRSRKLWPHI